MTSNAKTVEEYIERLPDDRREAIAKVRATIRKNLPKGFAERMQYGMISYVVPHEVYPDGYYTNPADALPMAALASQKNHMALYLMTIFQEPELLVRLRAEYAKRKLKCDLGKSCLRFRKLEQVPLDVIAEMIAGISVAQYIEMYERWKPQPKAAKKRAKKG